MKNLKALVMILGMTAVAGSAAEAQEIVREAESANMVVSPMKIYSKDSASGGRYVATNTSESGRLLIQVSIPVSGRYKLSVRAKAREGSMNSVYVSVDGGSKSVWHLPVLTSYQWTSYGSELSLSAGTHQLWLHGRERNTEIDVVKLSLVGGISTPQPTPTPSPTPAPTPAPSPTPTPTPTPDTSTSELNPNRAPASNFDLSLWKLTLPTDSMGGFNGTAYEIKPIPANYENEPYFYTAADGAMVFGAPVNGATTGGSKYARSELREMTASYTNAAWTVEKGGSLSATLMVNEVPKTTSGASGKIVVGQIHGPDDELCRLYYENGVMYFVDDKAGTSHKETKFYLKDSSGANSSIPLNSKFDYTIHATRTQLTVTVVHAGKTYSAVDPISSFWPGKALYFKAGLYLGVGEIGSDAGTQGTGQGRVTFYRLTPPKH